MKDKERELLEKYIEDDGIFYSWKKCFDIFDSRGDVTIINDSEDGIEIGNEKGVIIIKIIDEKLKLSIHYADKSKFVRYGTVNISDDRSKYLKRTRWLWYSRFEDYLNEV